MVAVLGPDDWNAIDEDPLTEVDVIVAQEEMPEVALEPIDEE